MKHKKILFLCFSLLLPSCNNSSTGKIIFDLQGGSFLDEDFSTDHLIGEAGTPVKEEIPTPYKEGYYFVGWREKNSKGSYRVINKRLSNDGKSYYYYPYGSDTFYAYFEPLVTIKFNLMEGEKGVLIPPKRGSENFIDDELKGYASKKILSTDYLPKVDASSIHLNFEYWYSEYPFSISKDDNDTQHYFLDTSKEKGIYRFDQSFQKGSMEFLLDSAINLYAHYTSDPTITIHFNFDEMENYSFQAKEKITDELTALMEQRFQIDYSKEEEFYFADGKERRRRFRGFFLDEGFTQPFAIDSPIYTQDIDIYLKWDDQVFLLFDFNGGTVSGQNSVMNKDYYVSDTLPDSLLISMTPVNENARFLGYSLEGKDFEFEKDILSKNEITLVAKYQMYPKLTLKYDYPTSYSKPKQEDSTYYLKETTDFSSYLDNFKNELLDKTLYLSEIYTLNENQTKANLSSTKMTNKNITICFSLSYLANISISTFFDGIEDDAYKTSFIVSENKVEEKDISIDDIKKDDSFYLFDGIYFDKELKQPVLFPFSTEFSKEERINYTLYKKMTKSILLSFVNKEGNPLFTLPAIPKSNINRYLKTIQQKLGRDDFTLKVGEQILDSTLPESDATISVIW